MDISIVIPCYNSGEFLLEAFDSTAGFTSSYEVIIVNDGSTDEFTLKILQQLKEQGCQIINQENGGPAKARNAGISVARGKYILPLDADNILHADVFEKALQIMESDHDISIVHTDIEVIGDRTGLWKVGQLNSKTILLRNQIDTCALIRKSALEDIGGYDEAYEVISHEDWDLWIRMYLQGKKFFYLEEVGFKYRVRHSSLLSEVGIPKHESIRIYFVKKYSFHYYQLLLNWEKDIDELESLRKRLKNRFRSIGKLLLGRPLF